MTDTFKRMSRSLTAPAEDAVAILPDDAVLLEHATRALYIGGAGDARVCMLGGAEIVFRGLQPGSILPLRVVRVFASGTTATGLVGLW